GCSNFAQIATPAATTLNDTGLSISTSYSYRVRATDAAGNLSVYSTIATATTSTTQTNPVVTENQQPGTTAWQLGDVYGRPYATDTVRPTKGAASAGSANKGQSSTFHVSRNTRQPDTLHADRRRGNQR